MPTAALRLTIDRCNKLLDAPTRHPLVSVARLDCECSLRDASLATDGWAVLLLPDEQPCHRYGRQDDDFGHSLVLTGSPRRPLMMPQLTEADRAEGRLLLFARELLAPMPLAKRMKAYTFFDYTPQESLHLSCREAAMLMQCLDAIDDELRWGIDAFTQPIVCNRLELTLNYLARFYHRQFITRHDSQQPVADSIVQAISRLAHSAPAPSLLAPTAAAMGRQHHLSAAYTDDLMRHATGHTVAQTFEHELAEMMQLSAP